MLRVIEATRFRGFRSFRVGVSPVAAFLGPNSSGKTTVLHAVQFACDALGLAIDADQSAKVVERDGQHWVAVADRMLVDYAKLAMFADWQALFVDQEVGEGIELDVGLTFEPGDPVERIVVRLECARNDQLKLSVQILAPRAIAQVHGLPKKSSHINLRLTTFLRTHAPLAVLVPPFYGTVKTEEYRSRAIIDRLLRSGDQSHVVRNLVVGLEPEQLTRLNALLWETTRARISRRTMTDELDAVAHLRVEFRDSNGEIELSAAGAGFVKLVALYAALSRWRNESVNRGVLFLLDEPEAHLHPRLQAEVADWISRLVTKEFGAQLLLATHSVDILNRLSTNGATLIRCDRTADPGAVELAGDADLFDALADWVDLTPFTAINFLASRRVLFCEGADEIAVLPKLAELRFRNNPSKAERFRRWAIVQLQGAPNAPVAQLLTRLVRSEVIRAGAPKQGALHVELVLDRDFSRKPGVELVEHDGVREWTTIWSRHSLESLFLDPVALERWVRASAHECAPEDLGSHIRAAIAAADADPSLNEQATDQLTAAFATNPMVDEAGKSLGGEQKVVHAARRARECVGNDPAAWQHGKSRSRFILARIRDHIALPRRNQFPTDIVNLIRRADLNQIGDSTAALPAEVCALLDRLALP